MAAMVSPRHRAGMANEPILSRDPVTVVLVDDSEEYLEQACRLVTALPGLQLVGWAVSGHEVLAVLDRFPADLVLVDLRMPGMGGLEATIRLKLLAPATKVVVVTLHDEPEYRRAAERAGADGFLPKSELVDGLAPLVDRLFPQAKGDA
jgi:DNA-binding NarL/FixJ family response regulator